MTNRNERGQFTSAPVEDQAASPAGSVIGVVFQYLLKKSAFRAYALAGAITLCGAVGIASSQTYWLPDALIPSSTKECPLPKSLWVKTWDREASAAEPSVQYRHIQITRCGPSRAYGTYSYEAPSTGKGEFTAVQTMADTWGFTFFSEKPEGPGFSAVVVRPLGRRDADAGVIRLGFEVGHDCECSRPGYAAPGPFTSLPATVTESHDPPPDIESFARQLATQPEIKSFPSDFIDGTKTKS